jgi:ribonuclease P protein component
VNRYYRLTNSSDIQRVRRLAKSVAHPLLVLLYLENNSLEQSKTAIITGKAVGGAVVRNRIRRVLREVIRLQKPPIKPGIDMVVIARKEIANATYQQVEEAIGSVLYRAKLVDVDYVR